MTTKGEQAAGLSDYPALKLPIAGAKNLRIHSIIRICQPTPALYMTQPNSNRST